STAATGAAEGAATRRPEGISWSRPPAGPASCSRAPPATASTPEFSHAAIRCLTLQFFFDKQQTVVLRHAVGTAQRTGLDLAGCSGHGQIGNRGVLGFPGTVRNHRGVAGR